MILRCDLKFPWHFDRNAKDLIKRLLQPDTTKRYGCLKNGAEDIKQHKWFKDIDWTMLEKLEYQAPIQPNVTSDNDVSNFDRYPDSMEMPPIPSPQEQREFEDF
jgi:serine/threonine protein kinase